MMKRERMRSYARKFALVALGAVCLAPAGARAQMTTMANMTPKVGDKARDFTLQSLDGATVRLSQEVTRGRLVLVVLRGWPGYQCPYCTRQFADFRANAQRFARNGAPVLFVYPGPSDGLKAHAEALAPPTAIPGFRILLDPDYTFTNAYGLRWDAPNETAYPSTFVIGSDGIVTFAQTSHAHGDRVLADTVLNALEKPDRRER